MKKYLLTLSMMVLAMGAFAQQVGQEEARQRALSFLQSQRVKKVQNRNGQVVSSPDVELAYISRRAKDKKVCFYVFNQADEKGFVIVGGDESAKDILGYSSNGSFDYENAPDNFKWWLSQYKEQISIAMDNPEVYVNAKKRAKRKANSSGRHDITELIKTKWNQSAPFNDALPFLGEGYKPLVTGCVATAMAQVMKFHNYPTKGAGSKSYNKSWTNIGTKTFAADFGATTYDWGNMLDEYLTGAYTEAQANAVATLMYHCGVSVGMDYGQEASSASSSNIPNAVSTYFGYDKSAQHVQRKYYTDEEWTELVYGELAAGRPVLYGGQDAYSDSGHEFVCHGYKAEDQTFAINWGWGGYQDGNFTLMGVDGLQPGGSGIGGAGTGASYTRDQDIIINMMPDQGGAYPLEIYNVRTNNPYMNDQSGMTITSGTINKALGGDQTITYTFFPWNLSHDTRRVQVAVMLKDAVSGACLYTGDISGFFNLSVTGYDKVTIDIKSSDFPYNGTYEVYPVVREKESDPWQRIRVDQAVPVPTIEVVGGQNPTMSDITFEISGTTVEERGTLEITHDKFYNGDITYTATPAGVVSIDENGVVTGLKAGNAKIRVTGEETTYFNRTTTDFDVTVTPYIKKNVTFSIDDTKVVVGDKLTISYVAPDYTGHITYTSSDNNIATVGADGVITGVSKGKVKITATAEEDELYKQTSVSFDIEVTEPGFIVTDYSIANNGFMTPSTVSITATFKNQSGYNYDSYPVYCKIEVAGFTGTLSMAYQPWNNGKSFTITFEHADWKSYYEKRIGKQGSMTFLDADETPISDPIPFVLCNELSIDYTMSAAGWGTICLPFETEVPAGLNAYSVTSIEGSKLVMEEVEKMEMNTPYLLSGDQGTYQFVGPDTPTGANYRSGVLVGNTAPSVDGAYVYAPMGSYVLQKNAQGLGFYRVIDNNAQKIRQYSAYLSDGSYAANKFFNTAESVTDIETIQEIAKDAPAYNLNGVRVNKNAKGFVIVNGKLIYNK